MSRVKKRHWAEELQPQSKNSPCQDGSGEPRELQDILLRISDATYQHPRHQSVSHVRCLTTLAQSRTFKKKQITESELEMHSITRSNSFQIEWSWMHVDCVISAEARFGQCFRITNWNLARSNVTTYESHTRVIKDSWWHPTMKNKVESLSTWGHATLKQAPIQRIYLLRP